MRDWRNGQTRTFKGRVGDRVSSSLTSRTNKKADTVLCPFFCWCEYARSALIAQASSNVRRKSPQPSEATPRAQQQVEY